MKFSIILFCSFSFVAANPENYNPSCPYEKTVDLTNLKSYTNGSYLYQDVLIPFENQSFYDYNLIFGNENVSAVPHRRGCVCDNPKFCIKLCCEKNEFYNLTTNKCEDLDSRSEFKWELKIRLKNSDEKTVNIFPKFIYQVGLPCREPKALLKDKDKWSLLENGDLYMHDNRANLSTLKYCFTPRKLKETQEYMLTALTCPMKRKTQNPESDKLKFINWTLIINTYGMTISVFFFIPTIVLYLMIEQLRAKVRGKILICYLISITTAYSIISFINISDIKFGIKTCDILGFVVYFSFISEYFWLSVLCFDIWNTIRKSDNDFYSRNDQNLFLNYSVIAWGSAAVFTGLTLIAELLPNSPEIIKPTIAIDVCSLGPLSDGIFSNDTIRMLIIFNFAEFISLSLYIYGARQKVAEFTPEDKKNAKIMLGLFLIMDFIAIIDIVTYVVPIVSAGWPLILANSTIALRGPIIFVFFVFNGYVLKLLKQSEQ